MSRTNPRFSQTALWSLIAATVAACGGGNGASDPIAAEPAAPPASAPVALAKIRGTVADGPLAGAIVCYDINDNGRCDSTDPTSAPTDTNGSYSVEVDPATAGRHRLIAMVPATAVDKDTGKAVGSAFTLMAPATGGSGSQAVFISPLTTLVQAQIDATGSSLDKAAGFVQSEAALAQSPLTDFTTSPDSALRQAATVARLVLLTMNQKSASLSSVTGQTDLSGGTVSADQLQQVVIRELLGILPALAVAASDPTISGAATPADREAALATAATRLVDTQTSLTAAAATLAVGIARLPLDTAAESATPSASLAALRYQDAGNWYYRALLSTAADNTPDANGWRRYYDQRHQRVAGEDTIWGYNNSPLRKDDVHWSGSAWISCPIGFRSQQAATAVNGMAEYSYCGNFERGVRSRSLVDIGGRSLRSVIETVRAVPGGNSGVSFAEWGPVNLDLLGSATMPAGAKLAYQTNTVQSTAAAYEPKASNEVGIYLASAAAGGDARNGGSPACSIVANQVASPAASLDELIARNPGRPCIFGANASTGARNEWWSATTASLGSLPNALTPPAGTGSTYTTTAKVRVAFVPGSNVANFYSCFELASGSNRNCDLIGTGSYKIETLGDARTMEFSGLPELALRVDFRRVFVERGGKVYFGFRTIAGRSSSSIRLNLPAANALFTQLGLPLLNPVD